jgi:hypothetical protein
VDSALSEAFNAHYLNALMSRFTEDLEFYHDAGGVQSYTQVRDGFGGVFSKNDGIRRGVVPGTLEVYPIRGYGAIEVGRPGRIDSAMMRTAVAIVALSSFFRCGEAKLGSGGSRESSAMVTRKG